MHRIKDSSTIFGQAARRVKKAFRYADKADRVYGPLVRATYIRSHYLTAFLVFVVLRVLGSPNVISPG